MAKKDKKNQNEVIDPLAGIPRAPEPGNRFIGYCNACGDFVELKPDFSDATNGHPQAAVSVILEIPETEERPHMPGFNWGAFLMPAIWGPAHGQWFAFLFYPVWLLLDNLIWYAYTVQTALGYVFAGLAMLATGFFTYMLARPANSLAYNRVAKNKTPEEFISGQRKWTVVCAIIAALFFIGATLYNLNYRV